MAKRARKPTHLIRFCPHCASRYPRQEINRPIITRFSCLNCGYIFYQNPKPAVGAVIEQKGKLLLVKRAWHPYKGWWDLPGGFLDWGESPERGLKRELREELGIKIRPLKILAISEDRYRHHLDDEGRMIEVLSLLGIIYLCEIVSGRPVASDDVADYKWFDRNKLPKRLAFKNVRAGIKSWLELRRGA